jgi:hypothetical protein
MIGLTSGLIDYNPAISRGSFSWGMIGLTSGLIDYNPAISRGSFSWGMIELIDYNPNCSLGVSMVLLPFSMRAV